MKLPIKNMVCARCVESVSGILTEMNLPVSSLELGLADIKRTLSENELQQLDQKLQGKGFELIFDRETELVNVVKSALIKYVEHLETERNPEKLSFFVSNHTDYNYSYLSKIFSDQTGDTIETYLIELKIERVKELLSYRRWTLSEIAWKLKYSSVQYLSNQFKKITGLTVTEYLKKGKSKRKALDQI